MNTIPLHRRVLIWLSIIVCILGQTSRAATLVWTNTAGGLWSNATNWSPNTVPGAADTAIITNSGNYVVTNIATVTITALTLGDTNATGTPTIFTSSAFTVTNTTVASNGVIALIAGTFTTAGPANIAGTLNHNIGTWQLNAAANVNNYTLTNGELRGANCVITNFTWLGGSLNSDSLGSATTIPIGGSLTITGAVGKTLSYYVSPGRTLNNNGTATWTGAGIIGQGGATINNGGTMTLNGDFGFAFGGSGSAPVFNNTGTLTKASGSGAFTLTQIYFNNFVTCNINSGSFAMNSCVVSNIGGIYLSPSGYFDLNSGTTALLGGILSCSSGDHFRFLGATTTLTTPNITTPSLFLNTGILNQNTNVAVDTMNQANGTWQLNVPVALNNYNLTNGELRGANITITNLNWNGGSLNSDALGNVTTVPAGGTLTISGATAKQLSYYVSPGRTLNNNGTATWTGAGITGQGAATINNNGTMTLNGDFSYAWGGAGSAAVFNNNGTLTKASGSGAFTLSSIIVNNNNTMNIASGSLAFTSSQFHNYGTATITAGTIAYNSSSGTNYGTLSLSAGSFADFNSGSTYTLGGILTSPNPDSIRVLGATVNLNTTNLTTPSLFLNTGILNQNTNVVVNTLNQAAGTWQLNVPIVINNYNLTNGELRGANCVITNLNWAGGSLNSDVLGNVTTIPIGGTLTISGATAKQLSYYITPGRTLNNNGTATWTGAGITGQGGATINNGGTMTLNGDFGFAWGGSGAAPVLNNTGTLTKASGSGAFTMTSVYFNNYVTANINTGSFALNSCAGTNVGGIYLSPSAFLDFNSGTSYELGGFLSCSAGDHIRVLGATVNLNTTNVTTPSLFLNTGTLNQNANVVVNTLNQTAGTWRLNIPAAINNYNLTNGEVRGANVIITNFNWVGGSLNSENINSNTVTIPSGGSLNISGATTKSMSDYSSANGRRLVNNGTGSWSGAGINGYYGPQLINNNLFSVTSDLTYAWGGNGNSPGLVNNGTFNLTSGTDFTLSTINFTNTGAFNITSGSLTMGGGSGGTLCFSSGSLNLDAGSILNANVGTFLLNGSFTAPSANSLRVNGMTTYINTPNIATPALLETAGTVFQNTNVVVPTYNIAAGTLYPAVPSLAFNTVNLTNSELRGANVIITNLNWLGGSLNGDNAASNTVTIPAGGVFNITGASAKSIGDYSSSDNARRVINNGTINWSGAGITGYYKPQLINNSLLNITSDLGYSYGGAGSGPWLINSGTANLWNGTDLTLTTVNFTNSGTFNLTNGSLTMGGGSGGTLCFNSGALNLDATSFLYANAGTFYLNGSLSSPAGNHVQFNGMTTYINTPNIATPALLETAGTVFQNTNVVVDTYNIAAGTLWPTLPAAFNTLNLTNAELRGANVIITNFNWLGGPLNSENANSNSVTVPAGGTLNISSITAKSMSDYSASNNGRRLINNGTGTWSGVGISGYYGPRIENPGSLNLSGDVGLVWGGSGNGPVFFNTGSFSKSAGVGVAAFTSTTITNSGTMTVSNGGFTVGAQFIQTAGSAKLGTNFTANSNVRIEAGTFDARGNIVGTFYNNGSSSPGASPGLITGSTLTNSPLGTLRFEIGGTNPGTNFDQFRLTGPAIIDGTADLSLANGFVPVPGNTFTSVVCSARSGVFTNLTFSGGYVFTALYTPTTVVFRAENALPTANITVNPTPLVCKPFPVAANAFDVGGVVTNTALILNGNVIATAPGNAVSTTMEIDFPGPIDFIAQAIDDQGGVSYATNTVLMSTLPLHTLSMGPIPTNDSFRFCMLGQVSSNYTIVSATNITIPPTNWVPVGSMEYTNGIFRYTVSNMLTNGPFRYYRAKQQ